MIEKLKKLLQESSEEKVNLVISNGILKLSEEQSNTVSFIFWLCYLVETDLNDIIEKAWRLSSSKFEKDVIYKANEIFRELINEEFGGQRKVDLDNLEYFSDKIKIMSIVSGNKNFIKILWKLNNLRNDISHNRIDNLEYNKEKLTIKKTKERIIIDYFSLLKDQKIEESKLFTKINELKKINNSYLNIYA